MPVVGTAGHVDHGKSTLVLALTGRDPDRWEEEKRRGLTIDLGFSWMRTPSGQEVSFVDVPGHERYAKNMLAGIEAIDAALLVVAADEGWMPQSEEHLAVLDLLGVEHGLVALTKVDRVDDELAEIALLEVEERLEGTSLGGAEIIPVSAPAGTNLDRLVTALDRVVAAAPSPDLGRPRLWVDRAFSISGAGTVVTGTLVEGELEVGERLVLLPQGTEVRVRGLQSHEQPVEVARPGSRVAVNVAGIDRGEVPRGSMLGRPGDWRPSRRIAVQLRPARYVEELTDRGAYHLHLGSGAWPARLRLLDEGFALLQLADPLPVRSGDRFILRETGRRQVVGGGRVIDPAPQRRPAVDELRMVAAAHSPDEKADALLRVRRRAWITDLTAHSGGGTPTSGGRFGGLAVASEERDRLAASISREVERFHQRLPLRPGLPLAELAERLDLPMDAAAGLVEGSEDLEAAEGWVRRRGYRPEPSDEDRRAWERARALLAAAGHREVPRVSELGLPEELLHSLVREGALVRVSDELVYLPEQIEELVRAIRSHPSPFTVSEFKEAAGISRKYAVPLLEWSDSTGITVRMGDRRRLR